MKAKLFRFFSFLVCVVLLSGCVNLSIADDEKIRITIWSFTPEFEGMIKRYYMPDHPEIDFVFDMSPTSEYQGWVENIMESAPASDEAPDIFTLEAAFVKKFVDGNYTGDLSAVGMKKQITRMFIRLLLKQAEATLPESKKRFPGRQILLSSFIVLPWPKNISG